MDGVLELEAFCRNAGCMVSANESMALHTTFKIGGPARLYIKAKDSNQAAGAIKQAKRLDVPLMLVGKGSNLLVDDTGVDGVVLSFDESCAKAQLLDENTILCDAGASLSHLCRFALEHSLTGLEFAWGIPGSVGGAVYMNAGAYGSEMKSVVKTVSYLSPEGELGVLDAGELDFSYRHSWFSAHPGYLITAACFALAPGEAEKIGARMDELMTARKTKQPLEYPSAGSTFKRPEGAFASALIDECGLKGLRVGGAMVSEKHAGFIINYENATAKDVRDLIALVQKKVFQKTGFHLEPEMKMM